MCVLESYLVLFVVFHPFNKCTEYLPGTNIGMEYSEAWNTVKHESPTTQRLISLDISVVLNVYWVYSM